MDSGSLIIHIVPLSAFDPSVSLPLESVSRDYSNFSPIGSRSPQGIRVNFDGVLKTANADQAAAQQRAYIQLFRTGIVEAVTSTIISNSRGEPIIFNLDDEMISSIKRYLHDLADIGVQPPFAVFVTLLGVQGARLNLSRDQNSAWYDSLGHKFDRDRYHFSEVFFETIPETFEECAVIMRPVLDQFANAAGAASSASFDRDGRYVVQGR